MPLRKYKLLRKAVEIEQLKERRRNLYDINRAHNDAKPLYDRLTKEINKAETPILESGKIPDTSWDVNPDAASQLKRILKQ